MVKSWVCCGADIVAGQEQEEEKEKTNPLAPLSPLRPLAAG